MCYGNSTVVVGKLGIPSAGVNVSISKLEKKLGKILFNRKRRTGHFSLTNEGSQVRNYLNLMVSYAEELTEGSTHDD